MLRLTPLRRTGAIAAVLSASVAGVLTITASPAAAATNSVQSVGGAPALGAPSDTQRPVVSMAASPQGGYWLVASDGGLFTYGGAEFHGAPTDLKLNQPIVDMVGTASGHGYWMVASDGGMFTYGDAGFYGSMGGTRLTRPIVSIAASPSGRGYLEVALDGGVFTFGDVPFFGSLVGRGVKSDAVDIVMRPQADGYWIITADGGIHAFGAAPDLGGLPAIAVVPNGRVVGAAGTADGNGLWITSSDGGVFTFGTATFAGAAPSPVGQRTVAIAAPLSGSGNGTGYWVASSTSLTPARPGDSGDHVLAIQNRLTDLHYWVGPIDARYGGNLSQAVLAFQKYEGLARTGIADAETVNAMMTASPPQALTTAGDMLEVDNPRQLLYVVLSGQTSFVFNVSTGSEIAFTERSPITKKIIVGDAITYPGRFKIYFDRPDGWRVSDLGRLWRPKYFNAGIAFHGSLDVPGYNASHGCVRLSVSAMNFMWDSELMPRGRDVWVY
ncbi:MAG: peptidoglycan-binding protein [Acidimicrobiia bacterium]